MSSDKSKFEAIFGAASPTPKKNDDTDSKKKSAKPSSSSDSQKNASTKKNDSDKKDRSEVNNQNTNKNKTDHSGSQTTTNDQSKKRNQTKSIPQNAPAQEKISLKELKRFLTPVDGINVFRNNSEEFLNGDLTIKSYPDLLDKLPSLPDLEPVIKKYVSKSDSASDSFNMQLRAILARESTDTRHDFSLMLPKYIQDSVDNISQIMNAKGARQYPSIAAFKDKYGDDHVTRTGILFAMLGGVFHPDHELQEQVFKRALNHGRHRPNLVIKELVRHRTITPNNYRWSGKDTTTFNFPSNFSSVVSAAMVDNIKESGILDITPGNYSERIQELNSRSKSIANTTLYNRLEQMRNLRLLIDTKLQHLLLDKI